MEKEQKYMTLTVETYPIGFDIKHFYLPVASPLYIGDVITDSEGKRYRVIDGQTQVSFKDIDQTKYKLFKY